MARTLIYVSEGHELKSRRAADKGKRDDSLETCCHDTLWRGAGVGVA